MSHVFKCMLHDTRMTPSPARLLRVERLADVGQKYVSVAEFLRGLAAWEVKALQGPRHSALACRAGVAQDSLVTQMLRK